MAPVIQSDPEHLRRPRDRTRKVVFDERDATMTDASSPGTNGRPRREGPLRIGPEPRLRSLLNIDRAARRDQRTSSFEIREPLLYLLLERVLLTYLIPPQR